MTGLKLSGRVTKQEEKIASSSKIALPLFILDYVFGV